MIDLPSYEYNDKDKDDKVKLNKENAGNIMEFINTMG
jgi:hypothetical protein